MEFGSEAGAGNEAGYTTDNCVLPLLVVLLYCRRWLRTLPLGKPCGRPQHLPTVSGYTSPNESKICGLGNVVLVLEQGSRGSCTANLSPCEKQLLLSFSTNGKHSTQHSLACILRKVSLNTDTRLLPSGSEATPHDIYM